MPHPATFRSHYLRAFALGALLCLGSGLRLHAGDIPTDSPFLPDRSPGAAGAAVEGEVQLSGMTSIGGKPMVCLTDVTKKKSRWVAVGTKDDPYEVLAADFNKNEVIVKVNGDRRVLPLRKSATAKLAVQQMPYAPPGGLGQPPPGQITGPVQAVMAPAQPQAVPLSNEVGPAGGKLPPVAPVVSKEEQEREARMLVSDLMEIGMRQRKAYEEARKKAEADNAAKAQK
jgi:hypothetical protein